MWRRYGLTRHKWSLKPVNFIYFLVVKNMLEEGLLEHDHITLNTIIYCVTKQQTDNQKFIHGRMITCYINYRASREKKHSADIDENNDFCFETPIISKRTDSLLINLTRSPRKKDSRPPLPPPPSTPSEIVSVWTLPLPSEFLLPASRKEHQNCTIWHKTVD